LVRSVHLPPGWGALGGTVGARGGGTHRKPGAGPFRSEASLREAARRRAAVREPRGNPAVSSSHARLSRAGWGIRSVGWDSCGISRGAGGSAWRCGRGGGTRMEEGGADERWLEFFKKRPGLDSGYWPASANQPRARAMRQKSLPRKAGHIFNVGDAVSKYR
jgi:hypothetical protein